MPFSRTLHKVSSLLSFIAKTTQVNFLKSSTLIFFPISSPLFSIPNGIDSTYILVMAGMLVSRTLIKGKSQNMPNISKLLTMSNGIFFYMM